VLPDSRRGEVWRDSIIVYSPQLGSGIDATLKLFRDATRSRSKIEIAYRSLDEAMTTRIVRPLAIEAWGHAWTATTWCELRGDFRTFRLDRIEKARVLDEHFKPEKGRTLADFLKRLRDEGRPRTPKSP
jgi:predicted DNA-binding transcriptional regulator YafY